MERSFSSNFERKAVLSRRDDSGGVFDLCQTSYLRFIASR